MNERVRTLFSLLPCHCASVNCGNASIIDSRLRFLERWLRNQFGSMKCAVSFPFPSFLCSHAIRANSFSILFNDIVDVASFPPMISMTQSIPGGSINLSDDRAEAQKTSNFFDGLSFTDRPLAPGEKLTISLAGGCEYQRPKPHSGIQGCHMLSS